uniref:Small ribosomal subunit protein uS9m n=1 Tax=Tetraodon nigroviridis TaxID=99883 RepID=H3CCS7_TETNG
SAAARRRKVAAAEGEKVGPEFIRKQVEEFNVGKRHWPNMMGEDPENFSQEDVDRSIAYLFPSGLFETKARPLMKHPEQIFPRQRAVQWGEDRRPFHFLFYTGKQSYYWLLHEVYGKILNLEKHEDALRAKSRPGGRSSSLGTSRWLTREELETLLVETVSPDDYARFLQLMERLLALPLGPGEEAFVLRYRCQLEAQSKSQAVPPLQRDQRGVAFSTAEGRRKTSTSCVTLRDCGSGRVTVNGQDYLHYFPVLQDREQLMFPLQFAGLLGRFDLECSVGGGRSGQAGALRLATSRALLCFLAEGEAENLRRAGLLTPDPRVRERKKPGQEGARKKFTWKKR